MDMERLKKQMDFILEIDKEKNIRRQTLISDASRQETDAEHAWHLAVMCALLSEYSNEKIDVAHTMLMVLMHDLVEIDAGDTYAYDAAGLSTQAERERKAADRIFGILPEDQGAQFRALWEEFEEYRSPDARYAHLLDNFQPLLLNDASDGKSWTEHQVKKSQIYRRNRYIPEISGEIWKEMSSRIEKHVELGHIVDDLKE